MILVIKYLALVKYIAKMWNKKNTLVLCCFLWAQTLLAQIVIEKSDIAQANDTIRISTPSNINNFNFQDADSNFLWDFSTLQRSNQRIKEFFNILQTNIVYSLFFADLPFNPNRANVADVAELSLPAIISSSDAFNFYNLSNSSYQQVGIGLTLAQIPTPVIFSDKDDIYQLPLHFQDADTGTAAYQLSIPGIADYAYRHTRINIVDGWGIIITPLDTFETLRIKTILTIRDSIFVSALNFGFGFNRPTETQYKWLAKGKKIPVLQVNTQRVLNNEVVSSSFYQDFEPIITGIFNPTATTDIIVYPNPSKGTFFIKNNENIIWRDAFITDLKGAIFNVQIEQNQAADAKIILPAKFYSSGTYILSLYSSRHQVHHPIYLQTE